MSTVLLAFIICGGLFAALVVGGNRVDHAYGQHGVDPTHRDLRLGIQTYRTLIDHARVNRCRPAIRPYERTVWEIRGDRLEQRLRGRQAKLVVERSFDGCAYLRHWFNTSGAACVKAHEGAWTSNTGNGYYGGFQADLSFQQAYGARYLSRYGTANRWRPIFQIHMAYRGWQARGWSPWPNTARACGLL